MSKIDKIDLTDFSNDDFTVLSGPHTDKLGYKTLWICKCSCGKEFQDSGHRLKLKLKRSCGCKNFTSNHGNIKYKDEELKIVSYKALVKRCRNHAKHSNKTWLLTEEECIKIFTSDCNYCGIKPSTYFNAYRTKEGKYVSANIIRCEKASIFFNGIDRINSSIGYINNNVVPCCKTCNFAKNELTTEEFLKWVIKIYEHSMHKRPTWEFNTEDSNP